MARGPTDALRARVAFVRSQYANLRPAVAEVHKEWIKDRETDFGTGGATTAHGAWKSNKPSTVRRKGHSQVLFGHPSKGFNLFKSVTDSKHTDHVFDWIQGGNFIELGTQHWKARIHTLGLGPGGIRRVIDPTTKQRNGYARILSNWVLKGKLP